MNNLAGYPYTEIEFTKAGTVYRYTMVSSLLQMLTQEQISDLLVISHGWNNDMQEARELYKNLLGLLAAEINQQGELSGRKFAVLGVLWPSKKFAEEELIPAGGAVSIAPIAGNEELVRRLKGVRNFFDGQDSKEIIQQAIQEASRLDTAPDAPKRYVTLLQSLITRAITPHTIEPEDYAASQVDKEDYEPLLNRLSEIRLADPRFSREGAADLSVPLDLPINEEGGGAGMSSWNRLVNGARNLLNFATYYQMKERAGKVGVKGLHPILVQIKRVLPNCRLHLIGHSFGARLVSAATAGPAANSKLKVDTLTLLQAAFSHYGFAENYYSNRDGLFSSVLVESKVKGPILISHTHNDKAVGIAYAIASRIARQSGEFLGDENDFYGGMGANGAQKTPQTEEHLTLDQGVHYKFQAGKLYNLNADNCVGEHSDICQPQVAKAIISAILTVTKTT